MGGMTLTQSPDQRSQARLPASQDTAIKGGLPSEHTSAAAIGVPDSGYRRNPFTAGQPILTRTMFFGREAERQMLGERIRNGIHTAVVGPVDIGISSLLRTIFLQRPGEGPLIAFADLGAADLQTTDGLARSLWAQWWGQVRPGYVPEITGLTVLEPMARRLVRAGHRLVVILDEYEQLLWRPTQFDALFHARLEALVREGVITLVTGTHTPLADLYQQTATQSTLYESVVQLDLGLLTPESAMALLVVPIRRSGLKLPDEDAVHFVDLAGAHPLFLHIAGTYLFDALEANRYSRERVEAQFKAAAEPFWQEMWSALPPPARAGLSSKDGPSTTDYSKQQMRSLSRKGLVIGTGRKARPFSRGFAEWSRAMQRAQQLGRQASAGGTATVLDPPE